LPAVGPKKDPGDIDKIEGKEPRQYSGHGKVGKAPGPMHYHGGAMEATPEEKSPTRPMPDAADEKGGHQIGIGTEVGPAIPPQGDIDVFPEKST